MGHVAGRHRASGQRRGVAQEGQRGRVVLHGSIDFEVGWTLRPGDKGGCTVGSLISLPPWPACGYRSPPGSPRPTSPTTGWSPVADRGVTRGGTTRAGGFALRRHLRCPQGGATKGRLDTARCASGAVFVCRSHCFTAASRVRVSIADRRPSSEPLEELLPDPSQPSRHICRRDG